MPADPFIRADASGGVRVCPLCGSLVWDSDPAEQAHREFHEWLSVGVP